MTPQEAEAHVNTLPFPQAQDGDNVFQAGYWFSRLDGVWVLMDPQPDLPPNYSPQA